MNTLHKTIRLFLATALLSVPGLRAQEHDHRDGSPVSEQQAGSHDHGAHGAAPGSPDSPNSAGRYLLGLSSGTSLNPASWPMPMTMTRARDWNLMWMGQAFVANTQHLGPRGSVMLRGMVSLDPLTVRRKNYPLLFQTGETANGKPLIDGQHPHDAVMELGIQYARSWGEKALLNLYYAPVGDAALGPVAFPHRASAIELPQATLGHHWQDATHIANNVATVGLVYDRFRLEASGFRGKEPNENRWNIDMGPMDSYSARVTYQPGRNWLAQVSAARIAQPEPHHADDVVRSTAALHHTRPRGGGQSWSSSLIWARNYKTLGRYATNSVLAETVYPISPKNLVTARLEWSQRDELFEYDHDLAYEISAQTGKRAFGVAAVTAGYTRELGAVSLLPTGIGFNVTACAIDSVLKPYYSSTPAAATVFVRFRLRGGE